MNFDVVRKQMAGNGRKMTGNGRKMAENGRKRSTIADFFYEGELTGFYFDHFPGEFRLHALTWKARLSYITVILESKI